MNTPLSSSQANNNPATLFRPDGWNRSIRIGTVVPHSDVGPDAELQAMATNDITLHGSRLYFSAMRAGGEINRNISYDPADAFFS